MSDDPNRMFEAVQKQRAKNDEDPTLRPCETCGHRKKYHENLFGCDQLADRWDSKKGQCPCKEYNSVAPVMEDKALRVSDVVEFLLEYTDLREPRLMSFRVPTHGSCCTCQDCGWWTDDHECICSSNEMVLSFRKFVKDRGIKYSTNIFEHLDHLDEMLDEAER